MILTQPLMSDNQLYGDGNKHTVNVTVLRHVLKDIGQNDVTISTCLYVSELRRLQFNSLWPWRHMATAIGVNIGSGNGLLPDGTMPLPEPILTNDQ